MWRLLSHDRETLEAGWDGMDLDAPYCLDPQVSLRPEDFGALVYHFGNRKLSFLKHPALLRVLENLDEEDTLRGALEAAGVEEKRWPAFLEALETLEESEMVHVRA